MNTFMFHFNFKTKFSPVWKPPHLCNSQFRPQNEALFLMFYQYVSKRIHGKTL